MPIFEYRCDDCGKTFESFVTAQRTPECPACHGANLAKLLSSPGMVGAGNGRSEAKSLPMSGGCAAGTCGCRPELN
ncbi:MAG: zinc ribbon domain-containing protein [Vicinamibacterales bacterium]